MRKKSDFFQRGMAVGARRTAPSISETADLLGENGAKKEKIFTEWLFSALRLEENNQTGLGWKKEAATHISTRYNRGMCISEHTTCRTLRQMELQWQQTTPDGTPPQLGTGNWGSNSHRLVKNWKQKIGGKKSCLLWWVSISDSTFGWFGQNFTATGFYPKGTHAINTLISRLYRGS